MSDHRFETVDGFRSLLSATPSVLTAVAEDTSIEFVSPSAESLLGYDPETLAGSRWVEFVHPNDRQRVESVLTTSRKQGPATDHWTEYRFRHADDHWVWLESTGSPAGDSLDADYVVSSHGATDPPRVETRFQQFVTHTPDVLTVLDGTGSVQYVSPSVERVLGYEPESIRESDAFERIHPDDVTETLTAFERVLDDPSHVTTVEHRYRTIEQDWRWVESRGRQITSDLFDDGVLVVSRDVSERKRRERELRRQNERLERFTDAISHDLRNPLDVLSGSLELARETGDQEHLERAAESVDRMYTLIDDLLTLAKRGVESDAIETISVATVATEAWTMVETHDAALTVDEDGSVEADKGALSELFENLFRNAIEHGGSDVTVSIGSEPWGFYVADDGEGFTHGTDEVFEPGYTTTGDGTGFGLCIVEQIADAHNWDVIATDSDAGGARFEFVCRND